MTIFFGATTKEHVRIDQAVGGGTEVGAALESGILYGALTVDRHEPNLYINGDGTGQRYHIELDPRQGDGSYLFAVDELAPEGQFIYSEGGETITVCLKATVSCADAIRVASYFVRYQAADPETKWVPDAGSVCPE
jgi:hypothetical protein